MKRRAIVSRKIKMLKVIGYKIYDVGLYGMTGINITCRSARTGVSQKG